MSLTTRETQILCLVAQIKSNLEIMYRSPNSSQLNDIDQWIWPISFQTPAR